MTSRFFFFKKPLLQTCILMLLVFAFSGFALQAQSSATQPVVHLDVVALDANGVPIQGLKAADFSVIENGKNEKIVSLTPGSAEVNPSQPRSAILLLDELNANYPDIGYARERIQKFFKENPKLNQPTMLVALTGTGLEMLHGYTEDSSTLAAALHAHRTEIAFEIRNNGEIGRGDRLNLDLVALQQMADSVYGSPTDTAIVWVAPGFETIGQMNPDHNVQVGLLHTIQQLSALLYRSRITLYSVDPRGVAGIRSYGNLWFQHFAPLPAQINQATLASMDLRSLVLMTGGKVYFGKDDLENEIVRALQDAGSYYNLQYVSSDLQNDTSLRVVQVNASKNNFTVLAPDGYYGLPTFAKDSSQDAIAQLKLALNSPVPDIGIPVLSHEVHLDAKHKTIQIQMQIDGGSLHWHAGASGMLACTLDVAAAEFSKDNKSLHVSSMQQTLQTKIGSGAYMHGHSLPVTISLPVTLHSKNRVRMVVRDDATDALGSADVSDLSQVQ